MHAELPYIAASVDVIGIAPGQTDPRDALTAINAIASLDAYAQIWVVVAGQRVAIDHVRLVHELDTVAGPQAERNTIELVIEN